jgi:hypothetical protein
MPSVAIGRFSKLDIFTLWVDRRAFSSVTEPRRWPAGRANNNLGRLVNRKTRR